MADELEGTSEFNRRHRLVTGEVPITVANSVVDMFQDENDQPLVEPNFPGEFA